MGSGSAPQQLSTRSPKPSPTLVRLCCGALALPQQVLWGCLAHPGVLWPFQPLGCSNCSLKTIYIFTQAGAVSFLGAMPWVGSIPVPLRGGLTHLDPQRPRAPILGGAGEGAPTVPVPATGGHLHTGAGAATPGTAVPLHLLLTTLGPPSIITSSPNASLVAPGAACAGAVQPVPGGWRWGCRGAGGAAKPPPTLAAGPAGFLLLLAGVADVTSVRSSSRQGGPLHPNFGAKIP